MNSFDYFEGWKYISAIFNALEEKSKSRMGSHIAPRYIFRGIAKRFFTESEKICELRDGIISQSNNGKDKTKKCVTDNNLIFYVNNLKEDKSTLCELSSKEAKTAVDVKELKPEHIYDVLYKNMISLIKKGLIEIESEGANNTSQSLLKAIENHPLYKYICPEQIRSGASIRLRDTEMDYSTISDYISYTRGLVSGFKSTNTTYKNFDELEILAEIQHRGGGSCLVDFSNNFLISLWFAVNSEMKDMGYLFCYDVNADAFTRNTLTYLNRHKWSQDIDTLLRNTRKVNGYLEDERKRFWLWRPSNLNGRIARQDSVFVFGIEKFKINEHEVDIIPIPAHWKRPILYALKVFFGINSLSVYPDIDGFATSHSKIAPINDTTLYINPYINKSNKSNKQYFKLNLIQKGMSNLLKGDYSVALEYFLKMENESQDRFSNLEKMEYDNNKINLLKIKLELFYSIGVCYTKLNNPHCALTYLKKAIFISLEILYRRNVNSLNDNVLIDTISEIIKNRGGKGNINQKDKYAQHYEKLSINKFFKIIDDYVDSLYNSKSYSEAINFVEFLLLIRKNTSNDDVLKTIKNCLITLDFLYSSKTDIKDINKDFIHVDTNISSFCSIIDSFNRLVFTFAIKFKPDTRLHTLLTRSEIKKTVADYICLLDNFSPSKCKEVNLNWMFDDILIGIKRYFGESKDISDYLNGFALRAKGLQISIHSNRSV